MTYQAPLLALSLVATLIYRQLTYKWERGLSEATASKGRLFTHYYVPLYIGFAFLTFVAIQTTFREMKASGYLDDTEMKSHFEKENITVKEAALAETDLSNFTPLKYFSMSAPFWTLCTVLVCFAHTMQHVFAIKNSVGRPKISDEHANYGPWLTSENGTLHDRCIQILALPAVYGLMSMKSVIRTWQIINNSAINGGGLYNSWTSRMEFLSSMYETNFMVADLYESWALYQFAELALAILEEGFEKRELKLESTMNKEKKEASKDGQTSATEKDIEEGLAGALKDYEKLAESVNQLTVQGIYSFVVTCLIQSTWSLIYTSMAYEGDLTPETQESILAAKDKIKFFFLGMGTVASSAAIGNIVVLEESFGDRLKKAEFFPSLKFWGTKILVSLAFLQSLVLYLPPFNGWTATQQNLLYSSMLCLECFLVALLHYKAWPHTDPWYHDDKPTDLTSPLIQKLQ
jgi:hypothetical protein